jgi:hypothetical protein
MIVGVVCHECSSIKLRPFRYVGLKATTAYILKLAQSVKCSRASDVRNAALQPCAGYIRLSNRAAVNQFVEGHVREKATCPAVVTVAVLP